MDKIYKNIGLAKVEKINITFVLTLKLKFKTEAAGLKKCIQTFWRKKICELYVGSI